MRQSQARAQIPARPHPGPAFLRMLSLLTGVFRVSDGWRALALILALAAITIAEVALALRLASWNADFFNLVEKKDLAGLPMQVWILFAIVGAIMCLQASSLESKMRLQIRLRAYLTARVRDNWMASGRHYRLRYMGGEHANEDGRIAEDVRVVSEMVVEFATSLLYAVTQLVLFAGVLWLYSGPLRIAWGGVALVIPGHMVFVALAYAGVGALVTLLIGHPLVRALDRRQTAEADYRAGLVNSLAHSSAIALTGAEAGERRRLAALFDRIVAAWALQRSSLRNLMFFTSGYGQLTAVLPLVILAPRYFSGEMALGTLMQVTIAFGQVTAALSWLSGNFASIAQWEASAERVLALHEAVDDLDDALAGPAEGRFMRRPVNGPNLAFRDLTLISSAGEILTERFSADIAPGERVLVEATPQAADALFRAIAGLSFTGAGRIELPEDSAPHFMGEFPYLPEASLLEALTGSPRSDQPAGDNFSPGEVARTLVDTGLARLAPALERVANWEQELGAEDQQRLGFAIALLRKPGWILMHDATSALPQAAEDALMRLLIERLPATAIIRIAPRSVGEHGFVRRISVTPARG